MLFVSLFVLLQIGVLLCTGDGNLEKLKKLITDYNAKIQVNPNDSNIIEVNIDLNGLSDMFEENFMFIMIHIYNQRFQEVHRKLEYKSIFKINDLSELEKRACELLPRIIDSMYILTEKISLMDRLYRIYTKFCSFFFTYLNSDCYYITIDDNNYYNCESKYLINIVFNKPYNHFNSLINILDENTSTKFIVEVFNTINVMEKPLKIFKNYLSKLDFFESDPEIKYTDSVFENIQNSLKEFINNGNSSNIDIKQYLTIALEYFIKYIMYIINTDFKAIYLKNQLLPFINEVCDRVPLILLYLSAYKKDDYVFDLYFTFCQKREFNDFYCPTNNYTTDSSNLCLSESINDIFRMNWFSIKKEKIDYSDFNETTKNQYLDKIKEFYDIIHEKSQIITYELLYTDIDWLNGKHIYQHMISNGNYTKYMYVVNKPIILYTENTRIYYNTYSSNHFILPWNLSRDYVYRNHVIMLYNIDQALNEYVVIHALLMARILSKENFDKSNIVKSLNWFDEVKNTYLYKYINFLTFYKPYNVYEKIKDIFNKDRNDVKGNVGNEIFNSILIDVYPKKKLNEFSNQHIYAKSLLIKTKKDKIITSIIKICMEGIKFINDFNDIVVKIMKIDEHEPLNHDCQNIRETYFNTKKTTEMTQAQDVPPE